MIISTDTEKLIWKKYPFIINLISDQRKTWAIMELKHSQFDKGRLQ